MPSTRAGAQTVFRCLTEWVSASDTTRRSLLLQCRAAAWNDQSQKALRILLSALAQDMRHGVLRLFVTIDRDADRELTGRQIAREALATWRNGDPPASAAGPAHSAASPHGRTS